MSQTPLVVLVFIKLPNNLTRPILLAMENYHYLYFHPPWIMFDTKEPYWSGWRQGGSELWFREDWLPFWKSLSAEQRKLYLIAHPIPDENQEEWQGALAYWAGTGP